MAKRLQVPAELEHLIEKREEEQDRRAGDLRSRKNRRGENLGPIGAIESTPDLKDVPTEERRREADRRQTKDRRAKKRRKS